MSSYENKVLIQSDRLGNEVEFIFKIKYGSGKSSVSLHDLPSKVHWFF